MCKVKVHERVCLNCLNQKDRAERHELKSRLWLFFFPFLFPPLKKEGKGEWIAKIVISSHAFLLDQSFDLDSYTGS